MSIKNLIIYYHSINYQELSTISCTKPSMPFFVLSISDQQGIKSPTCIATLHPVTLAPTYVAHIAQDPWTKEPGIKNIPIALNRIRFALQF